MMDVWEENIKNIKDWWDTIVGRGFAFLAADLGLIPNTDFWEQIQE